MLKLLVFLSYWFIGISNLVICINCYMNYIETNNIMTLFWSVFSGSIAFFLFAIAFKILLIDD